MRLSDIAPLHVLIGMAHWCVCVSSSTVQYITVLYSYVRNTSLLRASLGLATRHGAIQFGVFL